MISGAAVTSKGFVVALNSGATISVSVSAGGIEVLSAGGVASNKIVSSGGYQVVSGGGNASGATLTGGGGIVLNSGGSGAGVMSFVGTGNEIIVNAGATLSGATLSGFTTGDYIDLKALTFSAGLTSANYVSNGMVSGVNSGTVTVTNGVTSVSLALLGQYVNGNFTDASDGVGGTLLGDPPLSSGAIAHA